MLTFYIKFLRDVYMYKVNGGWVTVTSYRVRKKHCLLRSHMAIARRGKKKIVMIEAGLFEGLREAGGSWLMLNGDIQCTLEGIDEAQMGREKVLLIFFYLALQYEFNFIKLLRSTIKTLCQ